jgi:cytochrome c nitrite reductase small subunit
LHKTLEEGRMTKLPISVAIAAAVLALGMFVYVTNAPAYAGADPATCNNCHVMDSQYENWYHGGHRDVTECVDCHLPHDNIVSYYIAKGRTGMHDVYVFSTGKTPELIRAREDTDQIIQSNCIRCHKSTVENIMLGPQPFTRDCWDCHRSAAHGQRGISIVPYQDSSLYPTK